MPHRLAARLALILVALASSLVPFVGIAQGAPATQHSTYPLTVVDDTGAQVTFSAPPQRIVSLSPGHTETLFALGAGNRLVAVDTYSTFPEAAKAIQPRLTTYPQPSVEALVGLKPDLVLMLVEKDDVVQQLRQAGVPVLKLFPQDFDGTLQEIAEIGQVLDTNGEAQALTSDLGARRDAVLQAVAGAPRPRVFYEMDASDPTKPFTAGPKGFYGQLVDLAGGDNVFADIPSDFARVSAESVIDRNPDLILLTDAYSPYNPQSPAMVIARPGWDLITAVREGAIYALRAELFSSPGPRLIEGLEMLAYLLHPDRFATSGGPHLGATGTTFPFCAAEQAPTYTFGFATLADALGPTMGEPTECPHADATTGDVYQQTAKGLAIYRRATNTPVFTSGSEHWSVTADGVVHWTGDGRDTPAAAN